MVRVRSGCLVRPGHVGLYEILCLFSLSLQAGSLPAELERGGWAGRACDLPLSPGDSILAEAGVPSAAPPPLGGWHPLRASGEPPHTILLCVSAPVGLRRPGVGGAGDVESWPPLWGCCGVGSRSPCTPGQGGELFLCFLVWRVRGFLVVRPGSWEEGGYSILPRDECAGVA